MRIIKHVLSMFCSNNNSDNERFEEIRRFVMDKDPVGLDKSKNKLCIPSSCQHPTFCAMIPIERSGEIWMHHFT